MTEPAAAFEEEHDPHPELTIEPAEPIGDMEAVPDPEGKTAILGLASHGHRAVKQALTQRGVRESGGEDGGVPHQRYVRYFLPNAGRLPWCAYFVSWCFDTTGDRNHRMPWSNAGYVGSIHDWARANGQVVKVPQHGDIFGVGTQHTGLVAGSDPQRRIVWTIEGNYGDAVSQRNLGFGGLWFARMG